MIFGMDADKFILRIPVILFALTIHELAHGWTAFRLGDPTARDEGRLTLHPIAHLDLLGTIMLMTGLFGWAKPVPVNTYNLRRPKRDIVLVSFAGPLSNIILALCFGYAIRILPAVNKEIFTEQSGAYLLTFLKLGFFINCGLAFFNLLPLYPLDGSKILAGFLPDKHIPGYMNATRLALPIIFGLVILGALTGYNLLPVILNPIFEPFMHLMRLLVTLGN
jgi:Zn-dependent protease